MLRGKSGSGNTNYLTVGSKLNPADKLNNGVEHMHWRDKELQYLYTNSCLFLVERCSQKVLIFLVLPLPHEQEKAGESFFGENKVD